MQVVVIIVLSVSIWIRMHRECFAYISTLIFQPISGVIPAAAQLGYCPVKYLPVQSSDKYSCAECKRNLIQAKTPSIPNKYTNKTQTQSKTAPFYHLLILLRMELVCFWLWGARGCGGCLNGRRRSITATL